MPPSRRRWPDESWLEPGRRGNGIRWPLIENQSQGVVMSKWFAGLLYAFAAISALVFSAQGPAPPAADTEQQPVSQR